MSPTDHSLSSAEAKQYLESRRMLPKHEPNFKRFAIRRARTLLEMMQTLHPDLSPTEGRQFVSDQAIHITPKDGHTLNDAFSHDYMVHNTIETLRFNPDFLPLLGTASKLSSKLEGMEKAPRRSLRALARRAGVDPDYAVAFATGAEERLAAWLPESRLVEYETSFGREELKKITGGDGPEHQQQVTGQFLHALLSPAENRQGQRDYLVSPVMEKLLNLPHLARAHPHKGKDFNAMEADDITDDHWRYRDDADMVEQAVAQTPSQLATERYGRNTIPDTVDWRPPASYLERLGTAIRSGGGFSRK